MSDNLYPPARGTSEEEGGKIKYKISPVLLAMGLPIALASGPMIVETIRHGWEFNCFTNSVLISSLSCGLLVKLAQQDLPSVSYLLSESTLTSQIATVLGVMMLYDGAKKFIF